VELLRISQLVPMIVAWGLSAFVVLMALLAVDDEAVLSAVERVYRAGEAAGGGGVFGDWIGGFIANQAAFDPETGTFDPSGLILGLWAVLTTVLWLPALVLSRFRGPRPVAPLGPRLRRVALACGTLWLALIALRLFRPEAFSGGPVVWILAFGLLALGTFLASAWSLALSSVLGSLRDRIEDVAPSSDPAAGV
jgi:hypothetical protein